jgi:hypothetical protein
LGRISGLPVRTSAEGITRRLAPQLTGRFARFSAAITAEPANSNTSRAPETRRKLRPSAYFTADYIPFFAFPLLLERKYRLFLFSGFVAAAVFAVIGLHRWLEFGEVLPNTIFC